MSLKDHKTRILESKRFPRQEVNDVGDVIEVKDKDGKVLEGVLYVCRSENPIPYDKTVIGRTPNSVTRKAGYSFVSEVFTGTVFHKIGDDWYDLEFKTIDSKEYDKEMNFGI